jgi:hypothetical protein
MDKNICVLCGEREATTSDHIPPQGIYPKPRDNDIQFHTVPACEKCNGGTSKEDEEFKVAIGLGTSINRNNDKRLINWIAGTITHNKRLGKHVLDNHQRVKFVEENGSEHSYVQIKFEHHAYDVVAKKIVRGLFWRQTGQVLPKGSKVWIRPSTALDDKILKSFIDILQPQEDNQLNKNTFTYRCEVTDSPNSFWSCTFFRTHTFFAYVQIK